MVGTGMIGLYDDGVDISDVLVYGNEIFHADDFYRTYTVDGTTDSLESDDPFDFVINSVLDGDRVSFYQVDGGISGISASTLYHTINKNGTKFQLSLTSGGAPIDITGGGTVYRYETFGAPGLFGGTSGVGDIDSCKMMQNSIGPFRFTDSLALNVFYVNVGNGGVGNEFKNNVIYLNNADATVGVSASVDNDYNASNTALSGDANLQTLSSDPFTDAPTDFTLVTNTTAGATLGSPFDVDYNGNTRTTPSRGALEFGSGAATIYLNAKLRITP